MGALVFKLSGDASDLKKTLREVPKDAEKAANEMGRAMADGTARGVASGSVKYANAMKQAAARAMATPSPEEEAALRKKTMRERAENARAQVALERDAEVRARKDERRVAQLRTFEHKQKEKFEKQQESDSKKEERRIAKLQDFERKQKEQFLRYSEGEAKKEEKRVSQLRAFEARQRIQFEKEEARKLREADREARRMDDARARAREQRRRMEAGDPVSGGRMGLLGLTSRQATIAGGGLYLGHQIMAAGSDFNQDQSRIRPGLSRETHGQMKDWRTSAAGSASMSDRASLQAKMLDDIQGEMDKFRNESTDQGALANIHDGMVKMGIIGGKTMMQQHNEGLSSRIHAMTQAARSSFVQAQKNEEALDEQTKGGAGRSYSELFDRIEALRKIQKGQNMETEEGVREFQRMEAAIKSITPAMRTYEGILDKRASSAMARASFKGRRSMLQAQDDLLTRRRQTAPLSERAGIDAEQAGVREQLRDVSDGEFFANVDAGLMGADGRRAAMRQMNREQREINRQKRMDGSSTVRNARAFQSEIADPRKRGVQAEQNKRAEGILDEIKTILDERLKFPRQ